MKKQIHLNLLAGLLAILTVGSVGHAQIMIEKTVTVGKNVPDGSGQLISATTWLNSGIGTVSWVGSTLTFSSPFSNNPIVKSDLSGTLTFGSTSESPVTTTVFSAGQLTSLTQQFTMADAFDAAWKSSGLWTLKIRDTKAGGVAALDSWKLVVEGTSTAAGTTMDLGNGGIVRVASSGSSGTISANVNTGSSGNTATMESASTKTLEVTGSISGAGGLSKLGLGTLLLAGSTANTFTGVASVDAGTLKLQKTGGVAAISAGTIAINGGTLLLGAANQISDSTSLTLSGGTLNTAGYADQVGLLRVTGNSTISGLVTSSGGAATGSDFLFSSVDLSTYSTSSGSTLTLSGIGYGQTVNITTGSYTSWSSYSTTSLNNFQNKISFGNSGLKAQINFNGTSGLTYVTAIPEPKVYVAMAMLVVLVGAAEYRRRRSAKSAAV
jgi:autotransporter-associated beta strand protein